MKLLFKKYERFLNWSLGSFNVAAYALILFFKKDEGATACCGFTLLLYIIVFALIITVSYLIIKFVFKMYKEQRQRDINKEKLLREIDEELKKKNESNQ
ncbi:MAG TPA: hypothetical protein PLD63_14050 [Ignavibacteria bacterium]|nr:hypothetical protein [Ignavibacteria bacterium]